MKRGKRTSLTMKFLIYPLYILMMVVSSFILINDFVTRDYDYPIMGSNLSTIVAYGLILFTIIMVCNILLHKNSEEIKKKFIHENNKFIRITAGITIGIIIANVSYAFTPTITHSKGSSIALGRDMTEVREDLDYLIGSSQYSIIKDKLLNKDIAINNSVITLKDYPAVDTLAATEYAYTWPFKFSRVTPPKTTTSFGRGSVGTIPDVMGDVENTIPDNLGALDQNKILGYAKVPRTMLESYDGFSFSAKLSGMDGQCFRLFHRTSRVVSFYDASVNPLTEQLELKENIDSMKICIDNQSKKQFPNQIFFKEIGLYNIDSIDFWLLPDDNNTNIDINKNGFVNKFSISDDRIIFTKPSNTSTIPDPSLFCLQGFHKGVPDHYSYMIGNSYDIYPNDCSAQNEKRKLFQIQ